MSKGPYVISIRIVFFDTWSYDWKFIIRSKSSCDQKTLRFGNLASLWLKKKLPFPTPSCFSSEFEAYFGSFLICLITSAAWVSDRTAPSFLSISIISIMQSLEDIQNLELFAHYTFQILIEVFYSMLRSSKELLLQKNYLSGRCWLWKCKTYKINEIDRQMRNITFLVVWFFLGRFCCNSGLPRVFFLSEQSKNSQRRLLVLP